MRSRTGATLPFGMPHSASAGVGMVHVHPQLPRRPVVEVLNPSQLEVAVDEPEFCRQIVYETVWLGATEEP